MTAKPVDYSALTLVRLSPAQAHRGVQTHHPEFAPTRTWDEYEAIMRVWQSPEHPWAAEGRFVPWGLVRRGAGADDEVLAYCTTYRRESVCSAHGRVASYAISAVVCPPANRMRGYTRHMLRLLHYVIADRGLLPPFPAKWGAPPAESLADAHFAVLYSGVGREIYRKCTRGEDVDGWSPADMVTRVWTVPQAPEAPEEQGREQGWEWLDAAGVAAIQPEMDRRILRDVASTPSDVAAKDAKVAVLPAKSGMLEFQTFFLAARRPGSTFGLVLPAPPGGEAPFIAYTYTGPKSDDMDKDAYTRLVLLHVSHGRDAEGNVVQFPFRAVLAAARKEGVESIEHWGPTAGWDKEAGVKMEMDDNQPCIVTYVGDEEWVFCEKYSWC